VIIFRMFIGTLVAGDTTGGLDIFWILLPLLLCVLLMGQGRGSGGGGGTAGPISESWYTGQDIETTFKTIETVADEWRKKAKEKREASRGALSSLKNVLGGGAPKDRFVVEKTVSPRLLRMSDTTGPVFFELTEVEGGGVVVKATFNSELKGKIANFKASLPLRIPANPVGNRCPACGKAVLPEFNLCPYCGEKIIKA
jgi:hypothetical protein